MLRGFVTPFADLFVLAMQVRTACLNQTTAAPEFSFHWRTKQSGLSHLIFADVVFLFYKGDIPSILLSCCLRVLQNSQMPLLFTLILVKVCGFFGNIVPVEAPEFASSFLGLKEEFFLFYSIYRDFGQCSC